jgi:hypothetical protein
MRNTAVIDSGPLIALFDRDDHYHAAAAEFMRGYRGGLITTVAVLTEVTHLLDFSHRAQLDFLHWIGRGAVAIADISADDILRIVELTERYADIPMDFADASLVCICERLQLRDVVSIDNDFTIYRTGRHQAFCNLFPR